MTGIALYLRLAIATGVVLAPGFLLARALGVRSLAATLAWSLTLLFGALAVTFLFQATSRSRCCSSRGAAVAALAARRVRRGRSAAPTAPGRAWVWSGGIVLGILLWRVGRDVEGDGLFHLARARKLLELDELSLDRVSEFVGRKPPSRLRLPALARLPGARGQGRGGGPGAGRRPSAVHPDRARRGRRVRGRLGAVQEDLGGGGGYGGSGGDRSAWRRGTAARTRCSRYRRRRRGSSSFRPRSHSRSRRCAGPRPSVGVDSSGGARPRGRPSDVRDLPVAPLRRVPAGAGRSGRGETSASGRQRWAHSLSPRRSSCSG